MVAGESCNGFDEICGEDSFGPAEDRVRPDRIFGDEKGIGQLLD